MKSRRWGMLSVLAMGVPCIGTPAACGGITFGQIDTFQNGTTEGWEQGAQSPNPTTVIPTGGPAGAGDPYVQNVSTGQVVAGGLQVMFNEVQWTGNYVTAGVTQIGLELANFGSTPLAMRVAIQDSNGTEYASTNAVALPVDGGLWHAVSFGLTSSSLSPVIGSDSLQTALSNVIALRILSAANGPAFKGDPIAATLGADDIRGQTIPGDANHDGTVNFADLVVLAQNYNSTNATWEQGDFDFDGTVNFADLTLLAQHYGQSVSGATPAVATAFTQVPEPSGSLSAVACVALSLVRQRNQRRQ